MKILKRREFGDSVLRQVARELSLAEIKSAKIRALIEDMHHTLESKKLGVGLAAPQVGESLRLVVIHVQKTQLRPDVEEFKLTVINPCITGLIGRKTQEWEGCISSGAGTAVLFAKVPRHKKVEVEYTTEKGITHKEVFEGLKAQIMQHEIDHLDGILFVDRVKDTKSYMTYAEYRKHRKNGTLQ